MLATCALAGNFPDLDLVLTPLLPAPLGYLLHHRGHTHTVLYAFPQAMLLAALSMAVLAARYAGKEILDGVFNDVADLDGFTAEARQAKDFGFDGKTLIHPKQVEPCNTTFAPTTQEIALSQEIITAFEAAARDGRGVVTVNGRMVENLHVEQAQRVLAVAAAIGAMD